MKIKLLLTLNVYHFKNALSFELYKHNPVDCKKILKAK